MNLKPDYRRMFAQAQYVKNGSNRSFCIFIGAGDLVVLLKIVGGTEKSKTGRRWYDRVKESVEYICRNWRSFVFVLDIVLDIFFGM